MSNNNAEKRQQQHHAFVVVRTTTTGTVPVVSTAVPLISLDDVHAAEYKNLQQAACDREQKHEYTVIMQ